MVIRARMPLNAGPTVKTSRILQTKNSCMAKIYLVGRGTSWPLRMSRAAISFTELLLCF